MKAIPFGEDAWLIPSDRPLALAAALQGSGLDDVVPSEHVVLARGGTEAVQQALQELPETLPEPSPPATVTLPAAWDGPDLEAVAQTAGMSTAGVVAVLRETTFTVAFCGFSPGFGYLTGLPDQLRIPRRETPRSHVPAGSIAIAAGYCAVYPTDSPGGWHLLGTCATTLFDPQADPPALLRPGTVVRFA